MKFGMTMWSEERTGRFSTSTLHWYSNAVWQEQLIRIITLVIYLY